MKRRQLLTLAPVAALAGLLAGSRRAGAQQQLSSGLGSRGPADRPQPGALRLSLALSSNPRTWPILDGVIQPNGISFASSILHPSEMFYRQLKYAEFDVSEMSLSSLMRLVTTGDKRFTGLPVFTTHHFFHTMTLVRRKANINRPQDLKGKRVGVPEYQQTAAMWARGALQHEWGVAPQDIHWFMERNPAESHGGATGFTPPPGVRIEQVPYDKSIGAMMVSGELDATLLYIVDPNLVDRSTVDLFHHPDFKPLFPDPLSEGIRYFGKTGLYPINHAMVVRRELAEAQPWVVLNLMTAFSRAASFADTERVAHMESHVETGLIPASVRDAVATPVLKHGVKANRKVLEAACEYSHEQGLTPRRLGVEELFSAHALDQ
jgi:4,5-dihydroxyphthalate decarboxylase